ncbi:unnamed protein product [Scytosiphon promiscuus]
MIMNVMRWTLFALLTTVAVAWSITGSDETSGLPPSPTPYDPPTTPFSFPSATPTPSSDDDGGCIDEYDGDGYCDDENNNEDCDFDGGDCCECDCDDDASYDCGISGYTCIDPSSECDGTEEEVANVLTREDLVAAMDNDGLTKMEEVALAVGAGLFATIFGGICLFWYQRKYS